MGTILFPCATIEIPKLITTSYKPFFLILYNISFVRCIIRFYIEVIPLYVTCYCSCICFLFGLLLWLWYTYLPTIVALQSDYLILSDFFFLLLISFYLNICNVCEFLPALLKVIELPYDSIYAKNYLM